MRTRLPDLHEVLQVYAVIAVMFAGWTITAFLWKLSAWLLLLNLGEIFAIFSYAMAVNLLESLLILLILLAVCALLPPRWLREDFAVRGTILTVGLVGMFMAFVGMEMWLGFESGVWLFAGPLVMIMLTLFLWRASLKNQRVRSVVSSLSERITVFLLVLVPLFIVLSFYVLVRNLV